MASAEQLFTAIEAHDLDSLAKCLAEGADPNTKSRRNDYAEWRPLHAAINELEDGGPLEALTLLLRAGAHLEGDPSDEVTPLLMAVFRDQAPAVLLLLGAGATPNVKGSDGDTALTHCAAQGLTELTATLLRCGARQTIDTAGGERAMTPLGLAAAELDVPLVELLLTHGADPDAKDLDGKLAAQLVPAETEANTEERKRVLALLGSG